MAERYDAYVIGAGPAGTVCAGALADGGMRVGIAERELVGGECSYWACIPSKTLLRPGEALEGARHAPGAREAVTGAIDVGQALAWRNFQVSDWDDEASPSEAPWLREKGIDLHRGDAHIEAPGRIRVGDEQIETERIVLATGSDPIIPPVDGLADVDYWTNRDATGMREVPQSVVVLGGGPVGVELAQALRRFGADVAIVEGKRLLAREGERAGEAIGRQLAAEDIDIHVGVHAEQVTKQNGGVRVRLDDGSELSASKILVATGRRPRVAGLGVDSIGLDPDARQVEVDPHLHTGADNVWAIGDVTGVALFTHVGKYQARVAARNMLGDREARADYRALPRVTFCDPQVAGAGMTEEQAREHGIVVATGSAELTGVARTSTYTRDYDKLPGLLTLIADRRRGVLVGAYAVGPEAGEWLGQATVAIRAEVPVAVLRDTIQPFPTFSEAFVDALADLDV
jgi:pyruvate/2-oxoglutarate dehydrogenase complex dihydrolipoamide dehydrogenase (E3) component